MWSYRQLWSGVLAAVVLTSCAMGQLERFEPVGPQSVVAGSTLRLPLRIESPTEMLGFDFRGPDLPGLDGVASIAGNAAGGLFVYSPLASHIGVHDFTFYALSESGSEIARMRVEIEVRSGGDAAPVFLSPGDGGTYDVSRNPVVAFEIEVRDVDTPEVDIRPAGMMPAGATLTPTGVQRASFQWRPTAEQAAHQDVWSVRFEADDRDHPPVTHDYNIVLRSGVTGVGCTGEPPMIRVVSPDNGATVRGDFEVVVEVMDDRGLRDAPALHWTADEPADLSRPDLGRFERVTMTSRGSQHVGLVPRQGGEQRRIWFVVSATDDDDSMGSGCDHTTDTPLGSFYADPSGGAGARCTGSSQCNGAAVCLPWPGGYCARTGCTGNSDCGSGSWCVRIDGQNVCAADCWDGPSACRSGYSCDVRTDVEGYSDFVCVP